MHIEPIGAHVRIKMGDTFILDHAGDVERIELEHEADSLTVTLRISQPFRMVGKWVKAEA